MHHPTREQLENFGLGRLPAKESAAIERHVAACDSCCQTLRLCQDDTLADMVREAGSSFDGGFLPSTGDKTLPPELTEHARYRVLELLGEGGMGAVYKAEHRLMERTVALKLINRNLTTNTLAVERFRLEVKAAAKLTHPNIVTAHDAEQAGDVHFLVMEYVEGRSLDRLVKDKGPLTIPLACSIIRQAALGLQHAHDHGMVHRDIKPHNLMVTAEGRVKILDFGLARFASESDQPRKGLTAVDAVVGTPDYLAPEQARNARGVDHRADIYSLGGTLYFLLAGQPPFPTGTAMEKLFKHHEEEPVALEKVRPDTPPELAALVRKMMAKKPDERVQTPAEVAQALTPFIKNVSQAVKAEPPRRADDTDAAQSHRSATRSPRLAAWLVGSGVVIVALALLSWAVFSRPGAIVDKPGGKGSPVVAAKQRERQVLYILPRTGVWYADFGPVRDVLVANGVHVKVAANAAGYCELAPNSSGAPVAIDIPLKHGMDLTTYDAVIFGGLSVDEYERSSDEAGKIVRGIIASMEKSGKIVAALCTGQKVLAAAGTLQGKRAAYNDKAAAKFPNAADWRRDQRVAIDGRIITGGAPADAEEFARAIVEQLKSHEPRTK